MNKTILISILLLIPLFGIVVYLKPDSSLTVTDTIGTPHQTTYNTVDQTNETVDIDTNLQTTHIHESLTATHSNDIVPSTIDNKFNAQSQSIAIDEHSATNSIRDSKAQSILDNMDTYQRTYDEALLKDILTQINSVESEEGLFALQSYALQSLLLADNTEPLRLAIKEQIEGSENADLVGYRLSELYYNQDLNYEQRNELLRVDIPSLHNQLYIDSYQQSDSNTIKQISTTIASSEYMAIEDFINMSHKLDSSDYQTNLTSTFSKWLDNGNDTEKVIAVQKMIEVGDIQVKDKEFLQGVIADLDNKQTI